MQDRITEEEKSEAVEIRENRVRSIMSNVQFCPGAGEYLELSLMAYKIDLKKNSDSIKLIRT